MKGGDTMSDISSYYKLLNELRVEQIHKYDGYQGKPLFQKGDGSTSYYDWNIDKQCKIPIASEEELKKRSKT